MESSSLDDPDPITVQLISRGKETKDLLNP